MKKGNSVKQTVTSSNMSVLGLERKKIIRTISHSHKLLNFTPK